MSGVTFHSRHTDENDIKPIKKCIVMFNNYLVDFWTEEWLALELDVGHVTGFRALLPNHQIISQLPIRLFIQSKAIHIFEN